MSVPAGSVEVERTGEDLGLRQIGEDGSVRPVWCYTLAPERGG